MLNDTERRAIEGLFQRLNDVERKAPPRDPEAERLIEDEVGRQPGAPYYMAQTILVQEHALEVAARRIRDLEEQVRQQDRGNDIFGGLFGGGRQTSQPQRRGYGEADERAGRSGPWDRPQSRQDDSRGGGFLAGAAQTALGVTGGILIGNAIGSMFGGGSAQAAEAPEDTQPADSGTDNGTDAGNDDFGGFDDGGGFDMGGDF